MVRRELPSVAIPDHVYATPVVERGTLTPRPVDWSNVTWGVGSEASHEIARFNVYTPVFYLKFVPRMHV